MGEKRERARREKEEEKVREKPGMGDESWGLGRGACHPRKDRVVEGV